ncbi:MAG: hypothetical protein GOMPHAMPRED_005839 [Gomphillus americanus]|uniref:Mitochondrial distribution and morphology protein 10 n=1 Tax=Gomphillus americanus TaxID=1940652 RepID=A0A8H3IXK9_9LECA|nr:MAG: hypothetical protein GOMPHAMPRED_005839 [Gomphillus americanus]
MLQFMDFVQQAFFSVTNWNRDNSYGSLNATTRGTRVFQHIWHSIDSSLALLDFSTPTGLSLALSSLASPNFATSYSFDSLGALRGNVSYLFSSRPLHIVHRSHDTPLRLLVPGYRQIEELRDPDIIWKEEESIRGSRTSRRDTLIYGRLFLPRSHLEALYLRRLSPTTQLKISAVSSSQLRSGGSILFLLSQDRAKYSTEYLYSTDTALLGVRGLYNFGPDLREKPVDTENQHIPVSTSYKPKGRFSAGAELYYGILNKSGGMSTGFRFATLPQHTGFPYTMTLTVNPLMGNLTSTYAVKAGSDLTLCSKFDFNVYSYESGFQLGMELWERKNGVPEQVDLSWAYEKLLRPGVSGWGEPPIINRNLPLKALENNTLANTEGALSASNIKQSKVVSIGSLSHETYNGVDDANTAGVLKARVNQDGEVGLLWEGRLKELLYTFGVHIDFQRRDQIFRGVGLQIQYSS